MELPLELMHDILSRLPAKNLISLECVSKSCSEIIQDPFFIRLHQKRSGQTNTSTSIIFRNREGELLLVDLDLLDEETKSTREAIKLNLPWTSYRERSLGGSCPLRFKYPLSYRETLLVGSSNGLICLANTRSHQCSVGEQIFVLWNISTGKFQFLPFKHAFKPGMKCVYGFGYDAVHDDYKVVTIREYALTII